MKKVYMITNRKSGEVTYFEKEEHAERFMNAEISSCADNEFSCDNTDVSDYDIEEVNSYESGEVMSLEELEEYERVLKGEI